MQQSGSVLPVIVMYHVACHYRRNPGLRRILKEAGVSLLARTRPINHRYKPCYSLSAACLSLSSSGGSLLGVKGGCPPLARLLVQNAVLYTGVVSPLPLTTVIDRVRVVLCKGKSVGIQATHRKINLVIRWIGIYFWPSTRPGGFSASAGAGPGWRVWPGSSCTTRPNQQPGHTGQPLATRPDAGNHRLVDDKHPPPAAHPMTAIVSMPAGTGVHVRLESVFIFAGLRRWQHCREMGGRIQ